MANVNAPYGLRPECYASGAPYNGSANIYVGDSGYGVALFIGDAVTRTGEADARGIPLVQKSAAGDTPCPGQPITGVIVGVIPVTQASTIYREASTTRYLLVADDPALLYSIQIDGTITAASVGLNAVLIYTNLGSTVTGLSGAQLDTTSDVPAADASNQLTITRLLDAPDNDFGLYARLLVRINQSTETPNTLGV